MAVCLPWTDHSDIWKRKNTQKLLWKLKQMHVLQILEIFLDHAHLCRVLPFLGSLLQNCWRRKNDKLQWVKSVVWSLLLKTWDSSLVLVKCLRWSLPDDPPLWRLALKRPGVPLLEFGRALVRRPRTGGSEWSFAATFCFRFGHFQIHFVCWSEKFVENNRSCYISVYYILLKL